MLLSALTTLRARLVPALRGGGGARLWRGGVALLVVAAWALLSAAGWSWLGAALWRGESPGALLALLGLGVVALRQRQAARGALTAEGRAPASTAFSASRWLGLGALLLCGVALCGLGGIALPHLAHAALFCVGSFALLVTLTGVPWGLRAGSQEPQGSGAPLLLYLLCALLLLPAQFHLDALFGFRLRLWTTELLARQLAWLGVPSVSSASLLLLEGGAIHVDLPCSGVRSLWTGLLFVLALSILRRSRLNLRWALTVALFVGALLLANLTRVALIAWCSQVLHRPELGAVIHEPLGMVGFLLACALALALLPREAPRPQAAPLRVALPSTRALLVLAVVLAALCALRLRPGPAQVDRPPPELALQLPSALGLTPLDPTDPERDLLGRHGGALRKWRFRTAEGLSGSLLISLSRSSLAQHVPTACLAAAGFSTTALRTLTLAPGVEVAHLALRDDRRGASAHPQDAPPALDAYYWYQSARETTADPLRRLWLGARAQPVALVSILLDPAERAPLGPAPLLSSPPAALLLLLHQAVTTSVFSGVPHA